MRRLRANLVRGFSDAAARSAFGEVNQAIGGQALPSTPTSAADLLQRLADPTEGNVLPSAVFPDGPGRYQYATSSPLTKSDSIGYQSTVTWGQGDRHVDDPSAAKTEILQCQPDDASGWFWGRSEHYEFRAFGLPGRIHVGTFYPIPEK